MLTSMGVVAIINHYLDVQGTGLVPSDITTLNNLIRWVKEPLYHG